MTGNKEKNCVSCISIHTAYIVMKFNSREVKWKWNNTFSKLLYKSEFIHVMGTKESKARQQERSRYHELCRFQSEQRWTTATEFMRFTFSRNSSTFWTTVQAPVVQRVDNAIHRINHYPVDNVVCFANTYPLDSHLSSG